MIHCQVRHGRRITQRTGSSMKAIKASTKSKGIISGGGTEPANKKLMQEKTRVVLNMSIPNPNPIP